MPIKFLKRLLVGEDGNVASINSDGQLHTVMTSYYDTTNSSTTTLSSGAIFTGSSVSLENYNGIGLLVESNVASANKGLCVQYSYDQTTWHPGEAYTIPANTSKFFTPPKQGMYMRVCYTNGGTNQSDFHLHTMLSKLPFKWSSHNINNNLNDDDDAELVAAVLKLRTAQNNYVSGASTNSGNFKVSLEELESGISTNSNSQLKVTLFDSIGNEFLSEQNAEGDYHIGSAIIQKILSSTNNTTTTNLASGATFTGTADETFGINGIQVYHFADQDCTIYIDQSLDGTNWDITDSFECLANNACTRTFTSVAPYYRARVTNDGASTTTVIRFATGMTPIINPLPRALSDDGRLSVETTMIGQQNTDRHVWVTAGNAITTSPFVRLVGTNFDGTTKDTNFWTETVTGSGAVTQSGGEIELTTGTTANSTAIYDSVRTARFVVTNPMQWQGAIKFVTAGTTDNIRRFGPYSATDGFFFQLDGTTFSVGYRKASSDTLVNNGSFNGNYGPTWTVDVSSYHKFAIEWGPKGIFFYIDGKLLHKDGQGHRSNFLSLPIRIENLNDNGNTTAVSLDCLAMAIGRYGELITNGTYKYIGTNTTTVCKYGPGTLQRIVNVDNAGTVTVYDNTAASGTQIAVIDTAKALGTLEFNAPFSTGLTVVTATGAKITVIYE